jgi:uncharacterized protein
MDRKLLAILACPVCKGKLIFQKEAKELICLFDQLAFPIRDDIPIMLEEAARLVPLDEKEKLAK